MAVTTDYLSGFDYENGVLQTFPHAEGYVKNNTGVYVYHYIYKDHLGNNRLVYADLNKDGTINPATEIVEENNYYPFGLKHKGYNELPGKGYKYKYAGKELNDELGLDLYDFGARNYDPALGRWLNVDPYSEKFISTTPYNYTLNNPISNIDPDGRFTLEGLAAQNFVRDLQSQLATKDNDDDYKKNKETGRLEFVKPTNDGFDRIINSEGNSITVDKGVINSNNQRVKYTAFDQNGVKRTVDYDVYKFNNKKKAYDFYEFMSDRNTNWVEFSLNEMTSSSGDDFYTIGTIGEQIHEAAWSIIFDNERKNDANLRLNLMRHYHPWNSNPSPADIMGKNIFKSKYPNQNPIFLIDCKECEYDKNTQKVIPKSVTEY